MIPTPIFPVWRSGWGKSPELRALGERADDALTRRNRGRQEVPGYVAGEELAAVAELEDIAAGAPCDEEEPRAFRLALYRVTIDRLRSLVDAARWVRWLSLEQAFAVAAAAGDLHSSALILRSMTEELDSLLMLQRYEELGAEAWERGRRARTPDRDSCERMRDHAIFLLHRVLPMTRHPGREGLLQERKIKEQEYPGRAALLAVFRALNDYVHPNYGSHVLCLFPDRSQAGRVLLEAVAGIYGLFFSLPWVEGDASGTDPDTTPVCSPAPAEWQRFVDGELPRLGRRAAGWGYDRAGWPVPLTRFGERVREEAGQDDGWTEQLSSPATPEMNSFRLRTFSSLAPLAGVLAGVGEPAPAGEIELLRRRLGLGLPPTLVGCLKLAHARETADRLDRVCRDLPQEERFPSTPPYDRWVRFVGDCVALWASVTGVKMDALRLAVVRMLNARNPLGALICARSLLEHWAVAAELSRRFGERWAEVEKTASDGGAPGAALGLLEQELARFLTGTKGTGEAATLWRERLAGVTDWHINLKTAVKNSLPPETIPGYLYALFSRVIHGDCFTGGDLLPGITPDNPDKLLLKALAVLAQFEDTGWVMAASYDLLRATMRLHRPGGTSEATGPGNLGDVLRGGRLPSDLVEGRDVFGRGTSIDPYRFRSDLDYHDAFYSFCAARNIPTDDRRLWDTRGTLAIDVVRTPGGEEVYFAHDLSSLLGQLNLTAGSADQGPGGKGLSDTAASADAGPRAD